MRLVPLLLLAGSSCAALVEGGVVSGNSETARRLTENGEDAYGCTGSTKEVFFAKSTVITASLNGADGGNAQTDHPTSGKQAHS